jgi:hypothetical protein
MEERAVILTLGDVAFVVFIVAVLCGGLGLRVGMLLAKQGAKP